VSTNWFCASDALLLTTATSVGNRFVESIGLQVGKELDATAARVEASSARMEREMQETNSVLDSQLDRFSALDDQMVKVNELAKALAEKRERERVVPNGEASRDYWKTQIATLFDDDMDDADLEDLLPF